MKPIRLERGQFLAAGIVLIVVIALMVATLGYLYVSGERGGILHRQSDRAYFAARSGLEYATRQYFNGSVCSALNNNGVAVGGGTFSLAPTLYAPLTLTTTTAALTAASTSIPVGGTAGYASHGRLLIDSELINYSSTTGTSFDGLARGVSGTTAAAHAAAATVSQNLCIVASTGAVDSTSRKVESAIGAGTMASPGALGTMGADAMVVYAKGTAVTGAGSDRNIYYRLWDGTANAGLGDWGAEQTSTQQVSASSSPLFFSVRFARTRNEAIMGVLDGNSNIYVHVWNGLAWSNPLGAGVTLGPLVSTTAARDFQIAYEYTSDIARIVYQNNTRDPQYATWNGTALTTNGMILSPTSTYSTANAGARHLWFRLAPRNVAGSNEILLMTLDSNRDVYGARWTGAAWNSMGAATGNGNQWDASVTDASIREALDVAWQSDGSVALFIYGDANAARVGWRTWTVSTSTLSAPITKPTLTFPGGWVTAIFEWIRLYPDPGNNILVVGQTATPTLVSTLWSGGALGGTATGHDNSTVESAVSRSFDFAWEMLPAASGKGWLLWGSRAGGLTGVNTKYFTSPATWGAAAAIRDRTLLIQAGTLSPSGRFVAGAYHSTAAAAANQITESLTTTGGGTLWPNAATTLWGPGPVTTLQQGERVFVVTREGARINTGAVGTGAVSILQTQEILPP